jgi:hypothetical protein
MDQTFAIPLVTIPTNGTSGLHNKDCRQNHAKSGLTGGRLVFDLINRMGAALLFVPKGSLGATLAQRRLEFKGGRGAERPCAAAYACSKA